MINGSIGNFSREQKDSWDNKVHTKERDKKTVDTFKNILSRLYLENTDKKSVDSIWLVHSVFSMGETYGQVSLSLSLVVVR